MAQLRHAELKAKEEMPDACRCRPFSEFGGRVIGDVCGVVGPGTHGRQLAWSAVISKVAATSTVLAPALG